MRLIIKLSLFYTLISCVLVNKVEAQELSFADSINNELGKMQHEMDNLKRLKFSGYLQPQFQIADTVGINSYAGGNFGANTRYRFAMRRMRLKATYGTTLSQYVLQIDASEKGVFLRDVYAKFTEPWAKTFSLTMGSMLVPFGFEVPYSSGSRESPDRARMSQTLFPGERDLGVLISFQPKATSNWHILKLEGGLYNGSGITATDFDSKKDFIGNIGINKTTKNEKLNFGLRMSYYNGGVRQNTSSVFEIGKDSLQQNVFESKKDTSNFGAFARREYIGVDGQINWDGPFGMTALRAEYIFGQQPGSSAATASPSAQTAGDAFLRNFNGAYFYFLQNIGHTKHQILVKYDWYDPNTDVKNDDIGTIVNGINGRTFSKTNASDVKYSTLGLGWLYHWDSNIKLVVYYDIVKNESSENLSGYSKDKKDNVWTFRVQYKF